MPPPDKRMQLHSPTLLHPPSLTPHLCPTFLSFLGMRVFHITHLLLLLFVSFLFFLGFFIFFLYHFAATGFTYISPISICYYRDLLYFSFIYLLLQGCSIFFLYNFSTMMFSYVIHLLLVKHRPVYGIHRPVQASIGQYRPV